MPYFPQYVNATLVEFANYRTFAAPQAAITAASGDVITVKGVINNTTTSVVTLPEVALGGPVVVKLAGVFGVQAPVTIIPTVVDTVAGCLIDGVGSITLHNAGDQVQLASDGLQWWTISKAHNTNDTW